MSCDCVTICVYYFIVILTFGVITCSWCMLHKEVTCGDFAFSHTLTPIYQICPSIGDLYQCLFNICTTILTVPKNLERSSTQTSRGSRAQSTWDFWCFSSPGAVNGSKDFPSADVSRVSLASSYVSFGRHISSGKSGTLRSRHKRPLASDA